MNGQVSWFEVMGQDVEKLLSFYGALFGWRLDPSPDGAYHMTPEGSPGVPGGIGRAPAGPGWTTFYIRVADIAAAVERAVEQGGKVLLPPMDLPHGTTIAVIADPEGHPVGLSMSKE